MRVLRENRMGRGSVLSDTVGKNSLFVKGIFEKYGQGEKYVFDPVSFVYLLPTAAPPEEEAPKRDEERAREYVLREKETVRLITNSLRSREFVVRIEERAVMPSPREMLLQKAGKEQTICQVRKLVQKCREFERELSQIQVSSKEMAQSPDEPESRSAVQGTGGRKEREQAAPRRFQDEIEDLEKNLALWQEADASRDAFYQRETARSAERLLEERRILEQRLEYRLFDQVRRLCAEHVQQEAVESSDTRERQAGHTGAGESAARTEVPDAGRDSEERERFQERLTQVWQFLTGWDEPGEDLYAEHPERRGLLEELVRFIRSRQEEILRIGEKELLQGEPELRQAYLLSAILRESDAGIAGIETLTERLQESAGLGAMDSLKEASPGQTFKLLWQTASQMRPEELEQALERLEERQTLIHIRQEPPESRGLLEELRRESQKQSRKDEIQKDEIQKDKIQKDKIRKNEIQKDEIQKDEIQKDKIQKDEIRKEEIIRYIRSRQEEILRIGEKELLQGEPELRQAYLLSLILRESDAGIADIETLTERLRESAGLEALDSLKEAAAGQTFKLLWQTASQMRPEELEQAIERLEERQTLIHIRQEPPESRGLLEELRRESQKQSRKDEIRKDEIQKDKIQKDEIRKEEIIRYIRSRQEEILRIGEKELLQGEPELRQVYLLSAILRESDAGIAGIETLTERLQESTGLEALDSLKEASPGQTFKLLWQTASQMRPEELEQAIERLEEGQTLIHIRQEHPESLKLMEELRWKSREASLRKDWQESPEKKRQIQCLSRLLKETDPSRLAQRLEIRKIRQLSHAIELLEELPQELPQEFPERLLEVQRGLAGGMSLEEIDRAEAGLKEGYPAGAERERWVQKVLIQLRGQRLRQSAEQDFRRLLQVRDSRQHGKFPEGFWTEISESVGITTLIGRLDPQETDRFETWLRTWKGSPGEIVWAERLLADKLRPAERAAAQRPAPGRTYDRSGNSVKDLRPKRLLQDLEIVRVLEHFSGLTVSEDGVGPGRVGLTPEAADSGSDRRSFPDGSVRTGQSRGEEAFLPPENRTFQADDPGAVEGGYAAVGRELLSEKGRRTGKPQESGAGEIRDFRSLIVRQDFVKQEQTRQQERQENQRQLLMQLQNQNRQQENAIRIMEKRQEELQAQLKEPEQTWEELEKRVLERLQGQLRMERMRRGLL